MLAASLLPTTAAFADPNNPAISDVLVDANNSASYNAIDSGSARRRQATKNDRLLHRYRVNSALVCRNCKTLPREITPSKW